MPLLDKETGLKECSKCHIKKEASAFSANKQKSDGLAGWCKECHRNRYEQSKNRKNRFCVDTKECACCGEVKNISCFSKRSSEKDGYSYWCRECVSIKYYEKQEQNIQRSKTWRNKNKDRVLSYRVDYENHPEVKRRKKEYRNLHREHLLALQKKWYAKDSERQNTIRKNYQKDNPEVLRKASYTRRARKLNALVSGETIPSLPLLLARDGECCYYCGCMLDLQRRVRGTSPPSNAMEMEHLTPLSRGGKHIMSNLVLACRRCNREKSSMTEKEYFTYCIKTINRDLVD